MYSEMEKVKSENTVENTTTKRAIDKYTGTYLLKPCKATWLSQIDPQHSGAYLFENTEDWAAPERHPETGIVKTGLTDQEARELEEEMGLAKMTLSPYNAVFWGNFKNYPKVKSSGITLNLDASAMDKLRYCYLMVNSRVAKGYADALENPRASLVLTSSEKEAKVESSKIKVKMEAVKKLSEMTIQDQIDFLKVYQEGRYKVSKSATADFVLGTIGKIADEHPQEFIDTVDNPWFKTMSFLQDCVIQGLIRKTGAIYSVVGGDKIGNSFLDTVEKLNSPEYNETKISLKAKLETVK